MQIIFTSLEKYNQACMSSLNLFSCRPDALVAENEVLFLSNSFCLVFHSFTLLALRPNDPLQHYRFGQYLDCLCVYLVTCFLLLLVTCFLFSCLYFFLSYLLLLYLFLKKAPLRFHAGCRRRRLNVALVLCSFCVLCIFS